jgi:DNA-binding NarL/FixJ family response regulator
LRILIADDNAAVRRGVSLLLHGDSRFEVCGEASDGEGALAKAREFKPDILLLDLRMPLGNGLEIAKLLRAELPSIKVIIMSQNDATILLPSCLEVGAVACVDKSCLELTLLKAIDVAIGQTTQGR